MAMPLLSKIGADQQMKRIDAERRDLADIRIRVVWAAAEHKT